jgi:hypothetical protein
MNNPDTADLNNVILFRETLYSNVKIQKWND